MVYYIGVLNLD